MRRRITGQGHLSLAKLAGYTCILPALFLTLHPLSPENFWHSQRALALSAVTRQSPLKKPSLFSYKLRPLLALFPPRVVGGHARAASMTGKARSGSRKSAGVPAARQAERAGLGSAAQLLPWRAVGSHLPRQDAAHFRGKAVSCAQ